MDFEPRIMVRNKHTHNYAVWIYETRDWCDPAVTYYSDHFEIIAMAYTPEERKALCATVDYHNQLMKEKANA